MAVFEFSLRKQQVDNTFELTNVHINKQYSSLAKDNYVHFIIPHKAIMAKFMQHFLQGTKVLILEYIMDFCGKIQRNLGSAGRR
jgi:hypothetical protein